MAAHRFGVDIQPIAVQIAKLRAFITLVCDQETDLTDADRNNRMLPLRHALKYGGEGRAFFCGHSVLTFSFFGIQP